jgi:hypothetical protein
VTAESSTSAHARQDEPIVAGFITSMTSAMPSTNNGPNAPGQFASSMAWT